MTDIAIISTIDMAITLDFLLVAIFIIFLRIKLCCNLTLADDITVCKLANGSLKRMPPLFDAITSKIKGSRPSLYLFIKILFYHIICDYTDLVQKNENHKKGGLSGLEVYLVRL
jgi:hypothetical protein